MATNEAVKAGTADWFLSSRDLRADRWEFLFTRVVGGVLETHAQSVPVSVPYPEAEAAARATLPPEVAVVEAGRTLAAWQEGVANVEAVVGEWDEKLHAARQEVALQEARIAQSGDRVAALEILLSQMERRESAFKSMKETWQREIARLGRRMGTWDARISAWTARLAEWDADSGDAPLSPESVRQVTAMGEIGEPALPGTADEGDVGVQSAVGATVGSSAYPLALTAGNYAWYLQGIYSDGSNQRVTRSIGDSLVMHLDVKAFGAVGDGVADDTWAFQAAIDAAINSTTFRGIITVPRGRYKISAPLIISKRNTAGTGYDFVQGVELCGEYAGYNIDSAASCRLEFTYNNRPGIAIQFGRGITIRNLVLVGQNTITAPATMQDVISNTFLASGVRDNRYSPHAGIVIDPFFGSVGSSDQYPGNAASATQGATGATMASFYVGTAAEGTSHTRIENCFCSKWACGVLASAAPSVVNGEDLILDKCYIDFCTVGLGMGQSQLRNVNLFDCTIASCLYAISCTKYGDRIGVMPNIFGGNFGFVKWLFDAMNQDQGAAVIAGLYAESFLSLGYLFSGGSNVKPLAFVGCSFQFATSQPMIDCQAYFHGCYLFSGCYLIWGDSGAPMAFHLLDTGGFAKTNVLFQACELGSADFGVTDSPQLVFNTAYMWDVDGCLLQEMKATAPPYGPTRFSRRLVAVSLADMNRRTVAPGAEIMVVGSGTRYSVLPENLVVELTLTGLAVNGTGGATATIGASSDGLLRAGDMIVSITGVTVEAGPSATPNGVVNAYFGRVASVVGTALTLDRVIKSANAGDTLGLYRLPRFHAATIGDVANTSVSVTNVTGLSGWGVGDRIRGTGIPAGTYVTAASGTTITLSKAATATTATTRLYDADLGSLSPAAV